MPPFLPSRLCFRTSQSARGYASQGPARVFDRSVKRIQRERAARDVETSRQVDYLRNEASSRLCERILDINRKFPTVLDLGANSCNIAKTLSASSPHPDPGMPDQEPIGSKIGELIALDSSAGMLYRDSNEMVNTPFTLTRRLVESKIDDMETLPFPDNSFDAVLSSLSLHWVNDLPGMLTHVNRVLRPDSPFLGVIMGGDSLFELRTSLQLASLDRLGGVGLHVSPLVDVKDMGGLLQRTGFKLLTVDVDDLVVDYPDAYALMQDLQAMGEQNCVIGRSGPINRDVLAATDSIYRAMHGNPDGSIPATFRLIFMIGWKESPDQPAPLRRGSGTVNIKDILEGVVSKKGTGE